MGWAKAGASLGRLPHRSSGAWAGSPGASESQLAQGVRWSLSGGQTRLFSGGTPRLRPEGKEEEPAVSSTGNSILGRGNSRCKGLWGGAGGRAVRGDGQQEARV